MSTENREVFIEDIQNIAEIVWFDTLYQGGQDAEFAALIHNFMIDLVDQHLPPEYNPTANIRITSGQYIEKSMASVVTIRFEYSKEEVPNLPILTRFMRLDWDNNRWSLEAKEIDTYRVVRITHLDQTASYFPPAINLN